MACETIFFFLKAKNLPLIKGKKTGKSTEGVRIIYLEKKNDLFVETGPWLVTENSCLMQHLTKGVHDKGKFTSYFPFFFGVNKKSLYPTFRARTAGLG